MAATGVGRLAGKVAVVTGGGSGIGRAICQLFAKQGASVAVLDINGDTTAETAESLSSNHGNKHCAITIDVSSADQAVESLKNVKDQLGRSNILVNSAGIVRDAFFVKMSEKQFDDVIDVNLKGTFLMAREFARSLTQGENPQPGSVVNISSIVGKAGNIGQVNYAASKAGVIGMTKTMSLELARFNIRCNSVLPGFIKTPMTDGLPELALKMVQQQIPMRRQGEPEEIANACLFLASDESSYVTGACLEVTGGLFA